MTDSYFFIALKTGRWRLSIGAALATVSGVLLNRPTWNISIVSIFCGALLFTLACTWFNQIQERQRDGRMHRTRNRPLPRNTLPVWYATTWAISCLTVSIFLIFHSGGWTAIAILTFVLLLYNGFYTITKNRTQFSLIPGAIAGAIPPVLGWVCSGGELLHRVTITLFTLFFMWQVPHFWLAAERNDPDYESAGIPLPWVSGSRAHLHMLFLWVTAFCILLLTLPAFGLVRSSIGQVSVLVCVTILFLSVLSILIKKRRDHLFQIINLSMASICIILVAERIYQV